MPFTCGIKQCKLNDSENNECRAPEVYYGNFGELLAITDTCKDPAIKETLLVDIGLHVGRFLAEKKVQINENATESEIFQFACTNFEEELLTSKVTIARDIIIHHFR